MYIPVTHHGILYLSSTMHADTGMGAVTRVNLGLLTGWWAGQKRK